MSNEELAEYIVNELSGYGYGPHVHSNSIDGRSWYIHFDHLPKGLTHKLRISDHDERARYGYKWQLRTDGVDNVDDPRPHSKYFDDPDDLIEAFRAYYDKVETPENVWGEE